MPCMLHMANKYQQLLSAMEMERDEIGNYLGQVNFIWR